MAKRNLRRGFWRLAALVWAGGAILLAWWAEEARLPPLANVCTPEIDPPHRECFTDSALRLSESPSLPERLVARIQSGWQEIDTSKRVPRWRTQRYRSEWGALLARQGRWALLVWGPFYLLVWVFSGFRASDDAGGVGAETSASEQ